MSDPHHLLQYASDLIRAVAIDAGAPIATGQMGVLHNGPTYAVKGLPNIIWERVATSYDDVCWACYDSRRDDPGSGPVGYGETIDQALLRFHEQYAEESP